MSGTVFIRRFQFDEGFRFFFGLPVVDFTRPPITPLSLSILPLFCSLRGKLYVLFVIRGRLAARLVFVGDRAELMESVMKLLVLRALDFSGSFENPGSNSTLISCGVCVRVPAISTAYSSIRMSRDVSPIPIVLSLLL